MVGMKFLLALLQLASAVKFRAGSNSSAQIDTFIDNYLRSEVVQFTESGKWEFDLPAVGLTFLLGCLTGGPSVQSLSAAFSLDCEAQPQRSESSDSFVLVGAEARLLRSPNQKAILKELLLCLSIFEICVVTFEASPATGLQNRYYAVLRAEIPDFLGPVVVRTFSAYSALVGRGGLGLPFEIMEFSRLVAAETGQVELVEFSWPLPDAGQEAQACIGYVVMKRDRGFLLCLPLDFLSEEEVERGQQNQEPEGFGPSSVVHVAAVSLSEAGEWIAPVPPSTVQALVVDLPASFSEALGLPNLAEFSGVAFVEDDPALFPLAAEVVQQSREWLALGIAEQRTARPTAEVAEVRQAPPGSSAGAQGSELHAVGPSDTLAQAMLVQSRALTSLVSQMAAGSHDPMSALTEQGATAGLSTKGFLGRQKLQADLAQQDGSFFRAVVSSAARRMDPSAMTIQPGDAVTRGLTLCRYLERYGGYQGHREYGLVQWTLARALDQASAGSPQGALDTVALAMVMIEQWTLDQNRTELGWILSLQPEPPSGLFVNNQALATSALRPFANLAEQRWVAIALAYVKELEVLSTKRLEIGGGNVQKTRAPAPPLTSQPKAPDPKGQSEENLSRKQLRAKKWAESRAKAPLVVPVRSSTKQPVLNPSKDALNSSSAAALHANSEMPTFPRGAASAKVSFWSWAASLLRLLLATRTAFARFLLQTFKLSLGAEIAPPTALFPIPVPCPGCFGAGVPVFSSRRNPSSALRAVLLDRLLHITCMALNFLHSDGKPVPLESLRRQPNQAQLDMTGRLRRGVHLVSHLASLRDFLGRAGFVPSAYPGAARFEGYAAPCVDGPPALTPYRDVSPSRLLISGRGHWDIQPFLSPELWMPFVEPLVLRTIPPNSLPFPRALLEPAERTEELMKLWDSRGLLRLQPGPFSFRELCRVFAAFKNPEHDRMIGDRRGPNSLEGRVPGPSLLLPPGQMLVELTAKRGCQVVVGSSTDRSDFYHQILISRERARTNTIGPPLLLRDLADTRAHALFLADLASGCFPAEAKGCDGASCPRGGSVLDECLVFGSWASLFQGDHLGVEFATQAHERLLESHGLLDADHRLLSKRPVHHAGPWEALVIDDFFSISTASLSDIPADTGPSDSLLQTESARKVLQAKTAYASHDLKGSDHKDVLGSLTFKVAGASVDSSLATVRDGHVLVSAPVEKRLALAFVSLQAARLPSISRDLASGLAGSWVSTVLFRRCLMSCFDTFFALGKRAPSAPAGQFSEVVSLPRKAAGDLVLLSALAPVMCSDISTPFEESVFCSDSSLSKGAFCEAFVGERASSALWRSADKKGCSEPLAPAATAAEASAELLADPSPVPSGAAAPEKESLNKPLAMHYDFLEVFGGRGPVSSALAARGITNCLVLDLSVFLSAMSRVPAEDPTREGLENVGVNDTLLHSRWEVGRSWAWKEAVHINRLETDAAVNVLRTLALRGGDRRFTLFTRLNASDAPTRDSDLPEPSPSSVLTGLDCLATARSALIHALREFPSASRFGGVSCVRTLPLTRAVPLLAPAAASCCNEHVSGQTLETALAVKPFDVEAFVGLLVEYGRDLYGSGRPYWHFEETVNAITSIKPVLRRQVQAAWDLAFAWLAEEPSSHHTALPAVLLLGLLTTCLVWGWLREAGVFALAWGGILRMGEVTSAYRSDLVLPSDVLDTQAFVLLRLREPKTRLRAARHQSARVDRSDLIELIALAFKDLKPHERLWPGSGQTLRRRLDAALKGLKVPKHVGENRPIDLGSFRPGGATFLLIYSEDPELVRRRGRWLSYRTMEVYLQEVTATTFFAELPHSTRLLVVQAARGFPTVLQQVKAYFFWMVGLPLADFTGCLEVLVVGGGGGGGGRSGGGGAGGGLIHHPCYQVTKGTKYDVVVGAGGDGGKGNAGLGAKSDGKSGQDSKFADLVAKGGGGGGSDGTAKGKDGGSGGGGKYGKDGGKATQPTQSGDSGAYGSGHAGGFGTEG
ncbi:hypothetical protein AK812_SmicGene44271, partial [Symbiodinium microadriaticum]